MAHIGDEAHSSMDENHARLVFSWGEMKTLLLVSRYHMAVFGHDRHRVQRRNMV
jgi:hypothetical protein